MKLHTIAFAFPLLFYPQIAKADTLLMIAGDFCPYACDPDKEDGKSGFTYDILTEIFEPHGHSIKIQLTPWERAFTLYNQQPAHIAGIIGVNKELPLDPKKTVYPDEEICQYTHAFYAKKGAHKTNGWSYQTLDSIDYLKLGAVKGYSYCSAHMTKYVAQAPANKVDALSGRNVVRRNFNKLLNGRFDVWLGNIPMVDYFLYKQRKNPNSKAHQVYKADNLVCDGLVNAYPVFYDTPKGREYAQIFNDGMIKLRESGKLDEILARYGMTDWR